MRHLVAHPNQVVNQIHHPLVQVRPVRAADTIVAAMTLITIVSLVNAVIPMTNQSFGVVRPAFREKAGGTPATLTLLMHANGQLHKSD